MRFFLSIFVAVLCFGTLQAQESGYKMNKNSIRMSPFHLLANTMEMSYERYFSNGNASIMLMPGGFIRQRNLDFQGNDKLERGISSYAMIRMYYNINEAWAKKPIEQSTRVKFFAAPYYKIRYQEDTYRETGQFLGPQFTFENGDNGFTDQLLANEVGFLFGLQTITFDRLVVDTYFGGGYKHTQIVSDNPFGPRVNTNLFAIGYSGVVPRIGLQLGFAF